MKFNLEQIRSQFPILKRQIHGHPLVYLDNAATTLKPQLVIDRLSRHYLLESSNIHRGVHYLSEQGTIDFECCRTKVRALLKAKHDHEIIFTKGTTDSINIVAQSLGQFYFQEGDEVLITHMEHHSNIVPWQILSQQKGIKLSVVPINDQGEIIWEEFLKRLSPRIKLLSVVHCSNSLGTINPVKQMIDEAHKHNIPVLIDGAQAVAHNTIDVQELDCEFYVFSGHKIFGPTGIGVLYGKEQWLDKMPPVQGGGDMIASVTFEKTTYNVLPHKFEAGTPHIAGVIGLGAAIDYICQIGFNQIQAHEDSLLAYATEQLQTIEGLSIIGTAAKKGPVVSFTLPEVHPHDIGTLVDREGVAIRTGHHCTQPVMQRYNIPATARASFALYNTPEEIDQLVIALKKAQEMFR